MPFAINGPLNVFRVGRFLSPKNAIHHFHLSKKNLHSSNFGFFPYDVTLAQAGTPWLLTRANIPRQFPKLLGIKKIRVVSPVGPDGYLKIVAILAV